MGHMYTPGREGGLREMGPTAKRGDVALIDVLTTSINDNKAKEEEEKKK